MDIQKMKSFQGSSEVKVPGGKLVRVKCNVEGNKISKIQITGDFFTHPEETIQRLEEELTGLMVDTEKIRSRVTEFFQRQECTLIGVEPSDFIAAILKAASPPRPEVNL
ncbi:MAG: lipoate protein ligase C-terminal domain-containing protein [Candidatus Bathyarchaeia archaeon]